MEPAIKRIKYGGGVRVSSSKQLFEGDSIEDQKKVLLRFAAENNGEIVKWFDIIQSATNEIPLEQPFQGVINFCKENPGFIDCILVSRIDRFTRGGTAVYDYLRAELSKYGVYVLDAEGIIGNKKINTLAHLGLTYTYRWAIQNPTRENEIREVENAKNEAQKIARRLIGAEIRYTQNGYWMRKPPYGLKSVEITTESGRRNILVPGENKEYEYLKTMFALAERGDLSDAEIVAELNSQGYKSRKSSLHDRNNPLKILGQIGGVNLNVDQLRHYLNNHIYAGVICEKWTNNKPVKAQFDGIVSIETFNKINKGRVHIHTESDGVLSIHKGLVAEWRLTKKKDNPDFAYKKYVLCPICNNPLLGSTSKGKSKKGFPAYHCARGHKRYSVKKKDMDSLITKFIESIELSDSFMNKFLETLREEWLKREKEFNSKAINVNTQILELDKQIERELESFSIATSAVVRKMLEDKIERIQNEKTLLTVKRNEKEYEQLDMETILKNTRYYMEHLPALLMGSENPLENASFFGLLFERRPTYTNLLDGTPELSSLFKLNEDYVKSKSSLVTLRGIEPRSLP